MTEVIHHTGETACVAHIDESEGTLILENRYDSAPTLSALELERQHSDGRSPTGELYHAGDIPFGVIMDYCARKGITFADWMEDPHHVLAILNDSDYKLLRVWGGYL